MMTQLLSNPIALFIQSVVSAEQVASNSLIERLLFGIIAILIGLICVFYGYGVFRIALIIMGFIGGYALGADVFPNSWLLAFILGIVLAIVVAVLAYFIWSLGVVIATGTLGGALAASLVAALNLNPDGLIAIVIGLTGIIVGAAIGYFLKDLAVIILMAFAGGSVTAFGLSLLIPYFVLQPDTNFLNLLALFVFVGLGIIGTVVQYALFRAKLDDNLYYGEART
jgi:hypothetical protein